MHKSAEETRLPVDIDVQPLVQAAAALRPVFCDYQEEIERAQCLPHALVEQLHAAGFYRLVRPRALGGLQVDPLSSGTRSRPARSPPSSNGPAAGWSRSTLPTTRAAMDLMSRHGGSTSFQRASRLAECWRDLHVVGQTVTIAPAWYPLGGRVSLGMEPGPRLR